MKARKKGTQEWKEYSEVFGPNHEFRGKIVKVSGHVVVRNGIIYNEAYSGHISANTSFQPINRREKDTAR
jgi:hypothetical protein